MLNGDKQLQGDSALSSGVLSGKGHRAVPTLRGRLLNDTIITKLLEMLD